MGIEFTRKISGNEPKRFPTDRIRVSPCSGCETGHPSPPFALRSGDNLYVPRT
ncbi:MAG: hypothetical protein, partial [Olavius algarvensis Gamma 1 endosymbiont]